MRVLVVEDNPLLRHHLKVQLQDAGHQVDDAEDAKEADYFLNEHEPDIAIIDLGLPDEDGLSLIRRWRSNDISLPVLVLTAREGWQDKVEVLSAGADDYVTKPFHIEEVIARMQALLRRNSGLASQVISLPPFQVDLSRRELSINNEIINNLKKAYAGVTNVLASNPDAYIWAGRDFHQRPQQGINDYFWMTHDGQGAGVKNFDIGGIKFDLATVAAVESCNPEVMDSRFVEQQ